MAILLAHRGLWHPHHAAENTLPAFLAAAEAGYGVELDVRRAFDGSLVIQHDPPGGGPWSCPPYGETLEALAQTACPMVAINVKEEVYEPDLVVPVAKTGLLGRAFFFDQSVESSARLRRAAEGVKVLLRTSDRNEPANRALTSEDLAPVWGAWVDQCDSDWATAELIRAIQAQGKTAWIVSPELHSREINLAKLAEWREADGICTDFPHLYGPLLADDERLTPRERWWND